MEGDRAEWFGVRVNNQDSIPAWPLSSYMSWDKSLNLSESQFSGL